MTADMEVPPTTQQLNVNRLVYNQELLHRTVEYQKPKVSVMNSLSDTCAKCKPGNFLKKTIPVLDWMPKYQWKNDCVSDIIAGITIAIMHIPQGMAYAMLANVPPVIGLYMGFFPVLVYFVFGTSRHISMGTFAIICLMTGKTIKLYSSGSEESGILSNVEPLNSTHFIYTGQPVYSVMEVATAVSLMTGIIHILMYIFRLGIISTLLSETLVNGFITGAAVHVVTSQVKDALGIELPKSSGMFQIIDTYINVYYELPNINVAATSISLTTIVILLINNELIKPWISKRSIIPIPIELIVVVVGTLASNYGQLPEIYGITTVGEIPTGFPVPEIPRLELLSTVAFDSFTIAVVSYTISLSMALIFAQQLFYEVDANQELLAIGLGNVIGSFFSCLPYAASLSRSSIQKTVGGKTQLASVFSSLILIVVLLWIAPFFELLPKCVLAGIILVALKGMLMQAKDLARFWKLSKYDAAIWIVTFLSCVLFDIDIGLLIGVIVSLTVIFIQGIKPYTCLLGVVSETDLYLDMNRYKGTVEVPGIKIFHYCGGLNFASRAYFKSELYTLLNLNPQKELARREKVEKDKLNGKLVEGKLKNKNCIQIEQHLTCVLILDFSALSYIDPSGVAAVMTVCEEFSKINIPVYIAGCSGPVYETFIKCVSIDKKETSELLKVFPTVHDAVQSAKPLTKLYFETCSETNVIRMFPVPEIPRLELLSTVAFDSFTIAVVSYTISLSMALIFAQQLFYEVDANQELLAIGLGNVIGSFFSCLPYAASLSRSSIQKTVGGKTQLASVFSSLILIVVLLWIAPFFELLPKCVLAGIILVALKGMLMQAKDLARFWKLSKYDAAIWIVTFLSCVLFDIDIGLLIGVIVSLTVIFIQGIKPYTCLLGVVSETDLYLDMNRYKGTVEVPGIKIFHYCGGLNFASRAYFKSELYTLLNLNPQKELARREKVEKDKLNGKLVEGKLKNKNCIQIEQHLTCVLILDFSALSYIDPSGVAAVMTVCEEFSKINIPVYIAGCSGPVYETFIKCVSIDKKETSELLKVFPTVHDAVQSAKPLTKLYFETCSETNVIRM